MRGGVITQHQQRSHNAIFDENSQKFSVKMLYAIIDGICLGIPNNTFWDTLWYASLQKGYHYFYRQWRV